MSEVRSVPSVKKPTAAELRGIRQALRLAEHDAMAMLPDQRNEAKDVLAGTAYLKRLLVTLSVLS